jgi:hypothetical protein
MNKKILAKTLLPIATVALLGGGIASSLVACSKKQKINLVDYQLFNSNEDIYDYINENASHPSAPDSTYTVLDDSNYLYGSNNLHEGTKVQRIVFPESFSGTTEYAIILRDWIKLHFSDRYIYLMDGGTSHIIYNNGYTSINIVTDKYTIHGDGTNRTVITLANNYTMVYGFDNTPVEDDVQYTFNG